MSQFPSTAGVGFRGLLAAVEPALARRPRLRRLGVWGVWLALASCAKEQPAPTRHMEAEQNKAAEPALPPPGVSAEGAGRPEETRAAGRAMPEPKSPPKPAFRAPAAAPRKGRSAIAEDGTDPFAGLGHDDPLHAPLTAEERQTILEYELLLKQSSAKPLSGQTPCPEGCSFTRRICDLAQRICGIGTRHPSDADIAQKCSDAQDRCNNAQTVTTRCGCQKP